jgi:hypothetical protein
MININLYLLKKSNYKGKEIDSLFFNELMNKSCNV